MTEREIAYNTIQAYIHLKAGLENLKALSEVKDKIHNKEFVDMLKQVKPKVSYYVKQIDETLLNSISFKEQHRKELEEAYYQLLEVTDKYIDKIC